MYLAVGCIALKKEQVFDFNGALGEMQKTPLLTSPG